MAAIIMAHSVGICISQDRFTLTLTRFPCFDPETARDWISDAVEEMMGDRYPYFRIGAEVVIVVDDRRYDRLEDIVMWE